jgi:hypothetical protein
MNYIEDTRQKINKIIDKSEWSRDITNYQKETINDVYNLVSGYINKTFDVWVNYENKDNSLSLNIYNPKTNVNYEFCATTDLIVILNYSDFIARYKDVNSISESQITEITDKFYDTFEIYDDWINEKAEENKKFITKYIDEVLESWPNMEKKNLTDRQIQMAIRALKLFYKNFGDHSSVNIAAFLGVDDEGDLDQFEIEVVVKAGKRSISLDIVHNGYSIWLGSEKSKSYLFDEFKHNQYLYNVSLKHSVDNICNWLRETYPTKDQIIDDIKKEFNQLEEDRRHWMENKDDCPSEEHECIYSAEIGNLEKVLLMKYGEILAKFAYKYIRFNNIPSSMHLTIDSPTLPGDTWCISVHYDEWGLKSDGNNGRFVLRIDKDFQKAHYCFVGGNGSIDTYKMESCDVDLTEEFAINIDGKRTTEWFESSSKKYGGSSSFYPTRMMMKLLWPEDFAIWQDQKRRSKREELRKKFKREEYEFF